MPTYDYQCQACGHMFERFQSITAPAIKRCPVCNKLRVRRLIGTGGAIIFKGPGFYATDYRSESYNASAKAEKSDAKPSGPDIKSKDSGSGSKTTPSDSGSDTDAKSR